MARGLLLPRTPLHLVLLGPPGVGKGTYGSRLSQYWKTPHVGTGDLVRAEIAKQNELGRFFKTYVDKGELVPDSHIIPFAQTHGYILDGYPRTLEQAKHLLREKSLVPQLCVNITLADEFLIRKLSGRRVGVHWLVFHEIHQLCRLCGCIYNIVTIEEGSYHLPALLPQKCHQPLQLLQRDDDHEEVIRTRLQIYHQHAGPIIGFYKEKGLLHTFEAQAGLAGLPHLLQDIIAYLHALPPPQTF